MERAGLHLAALPLPFVISNLRYLLRFWNSLKLSKCFGAVPLSIDLLICTALLLISTCSELLIANDEFSIEEFVGTYR